MTIREQILSDLKEVSNQKLLYQILEFINILKKNISDTKGNRNEVLQFAGILSDEEADAIRKDIGEEFSKIEGDW
jgi:hypothetical protein